MFVELYMMNEDVATRAKDVDPSFRNFCKSEPFNQYKLKSLKDGIKIPRNSIEEDYKKKIIGSIAYMTMNAPFKYRKEWELLYDQYSSF
jgi:hypothetical protein